MRRFVLSVTLLGSLLVGACDTPTESLAELYTLATVNEQPLPRSYGGSDSAVEIFGGSIELRQDGTYTEVHKIRCKSSLPPGTTCHVEGEGTNEREGTYSRNEGWVEYNGTRFGATFARSEVVISFGSPSTGFPTVHKYLR